MANQNIKLNLLKLKNSAVIKLQGKKEVKKCLVIPVDDNHMFVTDKGCHIDLAAFASEGANDRTHLVKQSLPSEVYKALSEEERSTYPILGEVRQFKQQQAETVNADAYTGVATQAAGDTSPEDDLPF